MKPASCTHGRLLAIAICAALGASAAQAQDELEPTATQLPQQVLPTGEEDAAAAAPAARAFSAAVTQDADLVAELIEMTSESDEGLEVVELGDGSAMVDLEGRFMSVMMRTPDGDGGTTIGCFTGHDAAEHAKHAPDAEALKAAQAAEPTAKAPPALEEK